MSSARSRRRKPDETTSKEATVSYSKPKRSKVSHDSDSDALPSWKGAYICYCGVDAAGSPTAESKTVPFPQFCIATDVSGRAKCSECKETIEKGSNRMGLQPRLFNNSQYSKCKWYHPSCLATLIANGDKITKGFKGLHQIEQWEKAGEEAKSDFQSRLEGKMTVEDADEPHRHSDFCVECRTKGTHPLLAKSGEETEKSEAKPKASRAKKPKAKQKDEDLDAEQEEDEESHEAKDESEEGEETKKSSTSSSSSSSSSSSLPAWKGNYICYCGVGPDGRAIKIKVTFPQVCLCTDASGRATCKQCRMPIMKGTTRIGVQDRKYSHSGGGTLKWFHPGCFARNPPLMFQHYQQIEQWDVAPQAARDEILRNLPKSATAKGSSAKPVDHVDSCKKCRAMGTHKKEAYAADE